MELPFSFFELLPFIIGLAISGAIAGFLAGLFGVGGGAVLVPGFYQMLGSLGVSDDIRMHIAVGTSLAIIVPTSLLSFRQHNKKGTVDLALLKSFVVAVPMGVICASIVTVYISGTSLRAIFAIMAFVISMKLLFAKNGWSIGSEIPGNPIRFFAGWLIGFLSTFMGIGGGVFNNTFMTMFGRPIHQSVSTSSGVGVLIAIPGVIGYIWAGWDVANLPIYSLGYVNLIMVVLVIPITLLMVPIGVQIAHAISKRQLQIGFGLFLFAVSLRFFISLV